MIEYISRSKGFSFTAQIFFMWTHVLGKNDQNKRLSPKRLGSPVWEFLDPPLEWVITEIFIVFLLTSDDQMLLTGVDCFIVRKSAVLYVDLFKIPNDSECPFILSERASYSRITQHS